jgi:hypothetical protein
LRETKVLAAFSFFQTSATPGSSGGKSGSHEFRPQGFMFRRKPARAIAGA